MKIIAELEHRKYLFFPPKTSPFKHRVAFYEDQQMMTMVSDTHAHKLT